MIRDLKARLDGSKPSFSNDKISILQETKIFSKIPINSKKCAKLLTRILSLMNCGKDSLTEAESTDIFFGVTRLFEADDERLRRLIYLLIKSLPVNETEIFIVTSSLTKDMNSQNYVYRANAIRSICYIMRGPVPPQIERYLKASLVDKKPYVSSSTLLCCIGLFTRSPEMLKRWFSEITTCLSSKNEMVRFHATILLFLLRLNDKQSIRKLIATLEDAGDHVVCFIIRFLTANSGFAETTPFLAKQLSHHSHMVKLEAAKSVVTQLVAHFRSHGSVNGFPLDAAKALEALRALMAMGDVYTFAAMRQISILAQIVPELISPMNKQMETFISNKNRTLSSLALITLLQTGSADTIQNLLTQASNLSGDFKLEVTRAIKRLCISHPDKYKHVLKFLAMNFRQELSFASKNEMVDATIFIVNEIPKARTTGIANLCEFIEDCEYPEINSKVLKFLGQNIPKTPNPQEYVRFIYNRLMLENPLVRSASIDALENIARQLPQLRPCITQIVKETSTDGNFELEEQVNTVYNMLKYANRNEPGGVTVELDLELDAGDLEELVALYNELGEEVYLSDLSDQLVEKIERGIDLGEVDLNRPSEPDLRTAKSEDLDAAFGTLDLQNTERTLPKAVLDLVAAPLERSATARLTEEEEDYNVTVDVHVNLRHLVLEFTVENTLNDQWLEDVAIALNLTQCANHERYALTHLGPLERVGADDAGRLYVVLDGGAPVSEFDSLEEKLMFGPAQVTLNFTAVCSSDRCADAYNMNNLNFGVASYMAAWPMAEDAFAQAWEALGAHEQAGTFNLQFSALEEARTQVARFFGMTACAEGTQNKICWAHLAGRLMGAFEVLARASFAQPSPNACILKLQVRSTHENVAELLLSQLE